MQIREEDNLRKKESRKKEELEKIKGKGKKDNEIIVSFRISKAEEKLYYFTISGTKENDGN